MSRLSTVEVGTIFQASGSFLLGHLFGSALWLASSTATRSTATSTTSRGGAVLTRLLLTYLPLCGRMTERAPNFLCVVDHLMDVLSTSIIPNNDRLEACQEFRKVLILIDNLPQLCREYYKAVVELSRRLVESLLGIVPLVEGHRAIGLTMQGVLLNLPHEFSPVCTEEMMLVGGCGVEGTDALRDVRDG